MNRAHRPRLPRGSAGNRGLPPGAVRLRALDAPGRRARLPGWVAAAIILAFAGYAPAQETIQITRMKGALEVAAGLEREDTETRGNPDREFDRSRFEERIHLDLVGYSVDSRLLSFALGGSFGLRQDVLDSSPGESGTDHGDVMEYNGGLHLLRSSPVSLLLQSSRYDDTSDLAFGTDIDSEGETTSATLRHNWSRFPTSLSWRRIRSSSISRGTAFPSRRDDTRRILEFSGDRTNERFHARIFLRDEDVDDESIPAVGDYQIQEGGLSLGGSWGPYLEKSFRTNLRYFDRTNRFELESRSASSGFQWGITDTLTGSIDHEYNRTEDGFSPTTTNNATLGLRHQLYESLNSHARAFGTLADQNDGDRSSYGANLGFDYRKRLPGASTLRMNLAGERRVLKNDLDSSLLDVAGESLAVTGVTDNFLSNRNVDVSTIEVFDGPAGPQLVEGLDYEIDVIGNRVSINLLPSGAIAINDVLAVNYTFLTDPDLEISNRTLRFGIGWENDWLRLDYERTDSEDDLEDGELENERLEDAESDRFTIHLRTRRGRVRASATAHYLRERSESVDYDEVAFGQLLNWSVLPGLDLSLRLRQSRRDFLDPDRDTDTFSGGATLVWRPGGRHTVRWFLDFRDYSDSDASDQRNVDVGLRGDFKLARIDILPIVRWSRNERDASESGDLRAGIRFRRSF